MDFCSFILIIDKFIINIIINKPAENLSANIEMEANPTYITCSLLNVRKLVRVDDGGCNDSLTTVMMKDKQEN